MANATVVRKLKDVVTTKRVRSGVTLNLTNEEAILLRSLTAKIGGSPDHSARRFTNSIGDALAYANVPWVKGTLSGGLTCEAGSLDVIADAARDLEEEK